MTATDGVVVVDKPSGMTSFDVVDFVRKERRVRKAGHTGTLDPMATGVLPVCLGEATKMVPFLMEGGKVYRAEVELGTETETQDATGGVTARAEVHVTRDHVREVLRSLVGITQQVPPMHSALHHRGRRLYELARAGIQVDRPARPIEIHRLDLLGFDGVRVTVEISCSKGTYVRVLAADIGRMLGCGAHLARLRRIAAFPFDIEQAVSLEQIAEASLIPPARALGFLPAVTLGAELAEGIRTGGQPPQDLAPNTTGLLRLVGPSNELVAVAEASRDGLRLRRVLRGG